MISAANKNERIGIIGLGYVGLPLAVEFGKHFLTVGFDIDCSRVSELKTGYDRTLELGKVQIESSAMLDFSTSETDLDQCNILIVTVPTPIDKANRPDLAAIESASKVVAKNLNVGDIVVYESTVYPGCTEEFCVPLLETYSGLVFNKDFYCGYSPERVNPGDKVNTLTKIRKVTSGSNAIVAKFINDLYSTIIQAGTFEASSIMVAEAAKVIENSQRDLNIAFVNELSLIFDRLGIDTIEVLEAAGTKWNFLPFRPGLVGGHCIGVDPYYLTHKAEQVGYNPQVILAGRRINDNMARYVGMNLIKNMLANGINVVTATVGVLGLTFKEDCPDVRNTKVIDLIRELESWGVNVIVSDPWADPDTVMREFGISLTDIEKLFDLQAVVVAVEHKAYKQLSAIQLKGLTNCDNPVIMDVKSLYSKQDLENVGFKVFRL